MIQGGGTGGGGLGVLRQLLAKLGLPVGPGAGGPGGAEADGPGELKAFGPEGGLLPGLGYNSTDGRSHLRNRSELNHLREYLQSMASAEEGGPAARTGPKAQGAAAPKGAEGGLTPGEGTAGREPEARADRGDRAGREDGAPLPESTAEREREAAAEGYRQRPEEREDEERRHGPGWWVEEGEEPEEEQPKQQGQADAFAHEHRCRARLPDGRRCLHRASEGLPYCSVHRTAGSEGPPVLEAPPPPPGPENT